MTMIIPRDINPGSQTDIAALDVILQDNRHGNVQLKDDWIMVVDSGNTLSGSDIPDLSGVLVARLVVYVHELVVVPNGAVRRLVAESLVAHALSKAATLGERYAHFTVARGNHAMHEFIQSHGGVAQPDGVLYELPIPKAYYRGGPK